ncbi:unnamed protein product [Penicillium salamii]|nr:unnamed protein product [Penicillium salamii]
MIFVAAISGYDQRTAEDPNAVRLIGLQDCDNEALTQSQNQMHEAFILFDWLVNGEHFKHTPIILFLNKIDVFKKKLAVSPLSRYYADFTGSNTDLYAAARYSPIVFRGSTKQETVKSTHSTRTPPIQSYWT